MVEEKVREGYRRTEVGIIPEDWEVKTFKDILDYEQPGKYIVYSDIKEKGTTKVLTANKSFVLGFTDESYGIYKKVPVIIFDDFTTMNKLVKEPFKVKSSAIKILKEKDSKSDITYIYNLMQIINYPLGNHKRYYLSEYQYQNIMLPPLKEQKVITEVLSDTDNLITSLEKLINKKEKIKKGAMQKLLTGKERLPGFDGEWGEKELGEIGSFMSGDGFPLKYQSSGIEKYAFYKVSDFNNKGNEIYMYRANYYINDHVRKKISAKIIPKNSVLFAKIGAAIYLERKRITTKECCIDNNMMCFVSNENVLFEKYAYYNFKMIKLSKLVTTTALPSLSSKDLIKIKLKIPMDIQEQKAIAQILSDMDAEIEALNKKLGKYKKIKQGMMEELLTGRIRLV